MFGERFKARLSGKVFPLIQEVLVGSVEEFYEAFIEQVDLAMSGKIKIEAFDQSTDHYLITFLRCATSAYLQAHASEFEPYLEDFSSIKDFCRKEVDPMYKECDELQIIALTRSFGIPVDIFYLDRSVGDTPNMIRLPQEEQDGYEGPEIALVYKPGHYDALYLNP